MKIKTAFLKSLGLSALFGFTQCPDPIYKPKPWEVENRYRHEVWLVDQSNTNDLAFGGNIHIYKDEDLRKNASSAKDEIIDLSSTTAALCSLKTGANPVRPHMLVFNSTNEYAILAFVASGHIVIFNAETRTPIECFRTEAGVDGIQQAHAIWPAPDDSYILVANQNGKKFERITADFDNETFTQDSAATLNLATCTVPSGLPCQFPGIRPDNAPICPFVPTTGFPAYVSFRGGGMLVVDPFTTPMSILSEYEAGVIPRDGCGFIQAGGYIYGNGGGGNPANPDGWFVYRLPEGGPDVYDPTYGPNLPAPEVIARDEGAPRDAHGVAKTKDEKFVYFFDRAGNTFEQYESESGEYVKTGSLVSNLSADPTPDLVGEAPDGKYFYVSLRGPNPLSGDPHASTGSTPGLLTMEVLKNGDLKVAGLAPITNVDSTGVQRADGHGIRVRLITKKHSHSH